MCSYFRPSFFTLLNSLSLSFVLSKFYSPPTFLSSFYLFLSSFHSFPPFSVASLLPPSHFPFLFFSNLFSFSLLPSFVFFYPPFHPLILSLPLSYISLLFTSLFLHFLTCLSHSFPHDFLPSFPPFPVPSTHHYFFNPPHHLLPFP